MEIRTQRLNEAFRASGLTQTELCNRTGINKGALSSYLSGRYFPKQKAIESLADALNVSIPYLMGYEEMTNSDFSIDLTLGDSILLEKVHKLSPGRRRMLNSILETLLGEGQDTKGGEQDD